MNKLNNFKCKRCGECCRWGGYVRLTDADIDSIAKYLNLSTHDFINTYTFLTKDRRHLSLIEREKNICFFLNEDSSCQINPVKPDQCRNFPHDWDFPNYKKQCKGFDEE
jgi:Fe-S-cluster containining protein